MTDSAVGNLRAVLGGKLGLEALLAAEEHVIADAISKVCFWRRKPQFVPTPPTRPLRNLRTTEKREIQYIQEAAQRLRNDFNSGVLKSVDKLFSLPGIGPKMGSSCLHAAWDMWVLSFSESSGNVPALMTIWDRTVGICVAVQLRRITNNFAWHKPPVRTPEETR